MKRAKKSKPVGVLSKTFQILDLVQNSAVPLALKDISAHSGINKSTALRLLAHLEAVRYVSRNVRGEYSVGPGAPQAGGVAQWQGTLRRVARLYMWDLWHSTQESVNLGVLEGREVVYLECLESPHEFRLVAHVGMRAVLYRTALGKAMLAFMPEEKREALIQGMEFQAFTPKTVTGAERLRCELARVAGDGYAVDDEESHLGLRCIAAPVLDASGEAVAGISISGPAARVTPEAVPTLAAEVRRAAAGVTAKIVLLG
jgi:IclR family acetate operon transcriptional repressor